jgi:hypothetical protein
MIGVPSAATNAINGNPSPSPVPAEIAIKPPRSEFV